MDLFENNRLSSLTIAHPALLTDQATHPASLTTVITPGLEEHHIITGCLLSVASHHHKVFTKCSLTPGHKMEIFWSGRNYPPG